MAATWPQLIAAGTHLIAGVAFCIAAVTFTTQMDADGEHQGGDWTNLLIYLGPVLVLSAIWLLCFEAET